MRGALEPLSTVGLDARRQRRPASRTAPADASVPGGGGGGSASLVSSGDSHPGSSGKSALPSPSLSPPSEQAGAVAGAKEIVAEPWSSLAADVVAALSDDQRRAVHVDAAAEVVRRRGRGRAEPRGLEPLALRARARVEVDGSLVGRSAVPWSSRSAPTAICAPPTATPQPTRSLGSRRPRSRACSSGRGRPSSRTCTPSRRSCGRGSCRRWRRRRSSRRRCRPSGRSSPAPACRRPRACPSRSRCRWPRRRTCTPRRG